MKRPSVSELLRAMPVGAAALTRGLLAVANERGLAVYLVGGPVRDWLLERPLRDVDLIVEPGELSVEALAQTAAPPGASLTAHDRFGTVTLRCGDDAIDLATARRERYAHDGALPEVEPAPVEEDLSRRDFSVNALALPLSRVARGRHPGVVDPTGGLEDLRRHRLRALHARSFHDDPTRALRAARLGPRLGFTLGRRTRSLLRDALRDGAFGRVSGERLRREVTKLFEDAAIGLDPVRALRLLDDWHVLGALEPGLELPSAAVPALRRIGRAVETPPWPAPRWRPWVSGLAVWLAPTAPQLRRRALRRFAVRGALGERIVAAPLLRDRTLRTLRLARGRGAIDASLNDLGEEDLHALYAWATPAVRRRIVRYASEDRQRRLPINGADLTALGLSGPAVGRALDQIRLAVLDGRVRTREEALLLAAEVGRQRSGTRRPPRPPRKLPERG